MRKWIYSSILLLLAVPFLAGAQYPNLVLAKFNVPAQADLDVYLPGGPGDILGNVDYFQRSWDPVGPTGGWQTNQFKPPDIDLLLPPGPEGGNALWGNSNDSLRTREGYWIQLNPAITGSFTAEVFFKLDNLNPAHCEYKIQNIISTFWMSGNKAFELRFFGNAGGLGSISDNKIQVMTNSGTGENNITSDSNAITAGVWYYAAVVYNHDANQVSFYLKQANDPGAPTLIGTTAPGWGTFTMRWLCLAAWPNPAGSCRDICGHIDAFALTQAALTPSEFFLLNKLSVGNWMLF